MARTGAITSCAKAPAVAAARGHFCGQLILYTNVLCMNGIQRLGNHGPSGESDQGPNGPFRSHHALEKEACEEDDADHADEQRPVTPPLPTEHRDRCKRK